MPLTKKSRRRLVLTESATAIPARRLARRTVFALFVVTVAGVSLKIDALLQPKQKQPGLSNRNHVRLDRRIWSAEAFTPITQIQKRPAYNSWSSKKALSTQIFGGRFAYCDTRRPMKTRTLPKNKSGKRMPRAHTNRNNSETTRSPERTVWIAKKAATLVTMVVCLVLSIPSRENAAIAAASPDIVLFPPQIITALPQTSMLSPYPSSSSSSSSLSFHTPALVLAERPNVSVTTTTGPLVDTTDAILIKLDSGVTYRDLREGSGDADATASEGKRVNIQWVLKRSNGYSIDSSAQNDGVPFIFVVGAVGANRNGGANEQQQQQKSLPPAIQGLDEGIRGMRVGGIRRIVIPPSLAYIGNLDDPRAPGPVPPGFGPKQRIRRVMENRADVPDESFLLDVKLTRVQ